MTVSTSSASSAGWTGSFSARSRRSLQWDWDEDGSLKLLVAELSLHGEALKAVIRKNGWSLPV